ncbi:DUF6443 domain-containing protein, partial [Aquimarina sp. RZ0]|uniref:DUF6443 domain-containing protein n=1 Tax=Aquimarina sp. RZ0 TaxID=2607730 RepID=UPI001251626F
MIQNISAYITIALLFVSFVTIAQVEENVVIKDHTITASSTPAVSNIKATKSITIKPTTSIKSGSTFNAGITEDAYQPITLSDTENYVFSRIYQTPITEAELHNPAIGISNNSDVIESVTYFDGLGRPKQQIGIKASPDKHDIITHIAYDDYGRQDKQYLPFEHQIASKGGYKTVNIANDINAYYKATYSSDFVGVPTNPESFNAYSERLFEASPLNRVIKQGAPGKAWKVNPTNDSDRAIKFDWATNSATEVFYFRVDFAAPTNTEAPSLVRDAYYPANELRVTITKDENWLPNQTHPNDHTTKEYTDKLGRVILKRTYNENIAHDTYYVYDDYGNLTYVIPPKVTLSESDGVSAIELNELCYQYKYDQRNRLVEKKIPGKGWEYIVYNKLDQPVMTQDANQRANNEWLFTKYDAFGRIAFTGLHIQPGTVSRGTMQGFADTGNYTQYVTKRVTSLSVAGTAIYYSNDAIPTGINKIYTINYYDDYEVGNVVAFNPANGSGIWEEMTATAEVKGLPTVTQVRVLGTDQWIMTATYYDNKGRAWETHIKNDYLGTEDWILNKLDFAGKVLKTKTTHRRDSNASIVTTDTFTYDHMGRLLTQKQKI